MDKKKSYLIGLVIVVSLTIFDIITKVLMDTFFNLGESLVIIENFFSLTYVHNYGAAFSIFDGNRLFLVAASILGVVLFSYYFKDVDFKNKKIYSLSISMALAGTIGNLYDRLFLGYVRDMFDFIIFGYDFAVFNVADVLLVVGIFVFIILTFIEELPTKNITKVEETYETDSE